MTLVGRLGDGKLDNPTRTALCNEIAEQHMTVGDLITFCADRRLIKPAPLLSNLITVFDHATSDEWNFNTRSLTFLLPDPNTHLRLARLIDGRKENRKALRDAYAAIMKEIERGPERPEDQVFAESIRLNFKSAFFDGEEGFLFNIKSNLQVIRSPLARDDFFHSRPIYPPIRWRLSSCAKTYDRTSSSAGYCF
jgi:hypothetical protein